MTQDWILDVLSDLRRFAAQNGMNALVEQLDDTLLVAAAEVASWDASKAMAGDGKTTGNLHRPHAASDNA